jgi:hypothetical protein
MEFGSGTKHPPAKKLRTQCRFRKKCHIWEEVGFCISQFSQLLVLYVSVPVSVSRSLSLSLYIYIYVDLKMLEFFCCSWRWSGYIYIYVLSSDVPVTLLEPNPSAQSSLDANLDIASNLWNLELLNLNAVVCAGNGLSSVQSWTKDRK